MDRNFINKKDIFIILFILIIGIFSYYLISIKSRTKGNRALIKWDNEIIFDVDLSKDNIYEMPYNKNIKIKVENNNIWFLNSECPDQICVKTGKLHLVGERAVCLPNKTLVEIIGDTEIDQIQE